MARHVGAEHADLTICNLARRAGVLSADPAGRMSLLEETRFIDGKNRIIVCQLFHDIVSDNVTQSIRVPPAASQDSLLTLWARVAGRLRPHPSGFTPLIAEETV